MSTKINTRQPKKTAITQKKHTNKLWKWITNEANKFLVWTYTVTFSLVCNVSQSKVNDGRNNLSVNNDLYHNIYTMGEIEDCCRNETGKYNLWNSFHVSDNVSIHQNLLTSGVCVCVCAYIWKFDRIELKITATGQNWYIVCFCEKGKKG